MSINSKRTRYLALLTLIAISCPLVEVPAQDFEARFEAPWRSYDAGDFPRFAPYDLCLGDLDQDGDQDVVIAREFFGGPGISVLIRQGKGFLLPVHYDLPYNDSAKDVELLDVDADGDLDIVASIPDSFGGTNQIALWRNDGTGAFGSPRRYGAGPGPVELVVDDFNGDGFPDIGAANEGSVSSSDGHFSVLLHNGLNGAQAGFRSPITMEVGDNAIGIASGDIDGDGDVDAVIGRASIVGIGGHGVTVVFNDGSGNFGSPVDYEQVPGAFRFSPAVDLADMDNDGDLDLLAAAADNGSSAYGLVSIRENDGTGQFGPAQVYSLVEWSYTPSSVETCDLNGDGFLDIVCNTPSGRAIDGFNVLLSDGGLGFHPPQRYDAAKQAYQVQATDFDGDGDLDMISVANDSSVITVHENQGDGTYPVLPKYPVGSITSYIDSGDLDNDGDLDVVTPDASIRILRNRGDGSFDPHETFNPPINPGEVRLRDLNNDGFLDLLIGPDSSAPPYHFATALNRGDGTFAPGVVTQVFACQAGQIDAFDLDNDGDLDVVLTEPGSCSGQTNGRIFLARNSGDGSNFEMMTPLDPPGLPWRIGAADFDHDGNLDLASSLSIGLSVIPGNGDFTFRQEIPTSESAYDFSIADLDGDGNEDFAVLLPQDSFGTVFVATMRGYGDGGFRFAETFNGPNGREGAFRIVNEIDTADLDGDGHIDLLTTNDSPYDVSMFRGLGDGMVERQDRYGCGYSCMFSTAGDFNNDGLMDIASVVGLPPSGLGDAVVVLFGRDTDALSDVAPRDFKVVRGIPVHGRLADLFDSDDSTLQLMDGGRGIVLDVFGQAEVRTAQELAVRVETAVSLGTRGLQAIELFNFEEGRYETIDKRKASVTDSVVELTLTENAGRYLDGTTGDLALRLRWERALTPKVGTLSSPSSWTASIDQVLWRVRP